MVQSKVKYELIADERARRETLRKRKAGVLKKVNELKTLCNIDACAIIYSKNGDQPDVWPSPLDAHQLIHRFKNLPPMVQTTNMMDREGFLRQNISRMNRNLAKDKKKIRQLEMEQLMNKCLVDDFNDVRNFLDLKDLSSLLEEKIMSVKHKIGALGNKIEKGLEDGKEKKFI